MKRTLARGLLLLACTVLGAGEAIAAPRGPSAREREGMVASRPATGSPGEQQVKLEAWLARLQGTFSIKLVLKGRFTCLAPSGSGTLQTAQCMQEEGDKGVTFISTATCPGVGEGPGVYCKYDGLRRILDGGSAETAVPAFLLNDPLPIVALFGMDPASSKLSVMTMNGGSVVLHAMGSLKGNVATFDGTCDSALARDRQGCKWSLQIEASADGRAIEMKRTMYNNTFTIELSRVD